MLSLRQRNGGRRSSRINLWKFAPSVAPSLADWSNLVISEAARQRNNNSEVSDGRGRYSDEEDDESTDESKLAASWRHFYFHVVSTVDSRSDTTREMRIWFGQSHIDAKFSSDISLSSHFGSELNHRTLILQRKVEYSRRGSSFIPFSLLSYIKDLLLILHLKKRSFMRVLLACYISNETTG